MIGPVLITSVMVGLIFAVAYFLNRSENNESIDYRQAYGDKGIETLIGAVILLWIVPWGLFLIVPILGILSVISPAGRQSWKEFGKIRAYAISSMLLLLLLGGFAPTSEPISPEEWGTPLFTENPNAPLYPAGQQYTWLLSEGGGLNVEIVQSLTIRTTHQFSKISLAQSTFAIADLFGMQQSRLNQAIDLLDEQIVFNINSDEMDLKPIQDKGKHTFTADNTEHELDIRLYELRSLTLSSDPDGFKVGEIFCVAKSSWGGELDILVVVRPIGHTGLAQDRYAETLTSQWIASS